MVGGGGLYRGGRVGGVGGDVVHAPPGEDQGPADDQQVACAVPAVWLDADDLLQAGLVPERVVQVRARPASRSRRCGSAPWSPAVSFC